jgi:hypothetical protein
MEKSGEKVHISLLLTASTTASTANLQRRLRVREGDLKKINPSLLTPIQK